MRCLFLIGRGGFWIANLAASVLPASLTGRQGRARQLSQSWMCPYNVWHLSCVLWIIWISELRSQCCEHRSEEGQLLPHANLRSRDQTCPLGFRSGASASTARSAEEIYPFIVYLLTCQISR